MGSYGASRAEFDAIQGNGGVHYAPLLAPYEKYYPRRELSEEEQGKCGRSCPAGFAGKKGKGYKWGVEMGRRMRDAIRRTGRPIEMYQFDEIIPSASKNLRALSWITGALDGVYLGRPELGDKPLQGVVHVAHQRALAELKLSPVVRKFWASLNRAAKYIIFEQYAPFKGDPRAAAARDLDFLPRMLRSSSAAKRAVARRYVVGLTPGMRKGTYLGGKVPGQSIAAAHKWRDAYMQACLDYGSKAVSVYNWTKGRNTITETIRKVLKAIADAK